VLCLPDSYTAEGEPTPLILSCHGAGNTVSEEKGKIGGIAYASECIRSGYAALDISGSEAHGLTMGCPEHVFALYKAYRYAIKNYNLTERVLVAGHSMGGGTAINFANTFPSLVIALGVMNPGLSFHAVMVGDHVCRNPWDRKFEDGYRYRIKICGVQKDVEEAISQARGVKSVTVTGERELESYAYVLESERGVDARKPIFSLCAQKNWPIIGMVPSGTDLESIFIRLVDRSNGDEPQKSKRRLAH
jgi:hypothetical protein